MKFNLYWLTGKKKETVEGDTIEDAFRKAGYGSGAIKALDYYEPLEEEKNKPSYWFSLSFQEATCLLNDAAKYQSLAFLWEMAFNPDSKGNGGIILLKGEDAPLFKDLFLDDFGEMFFPDMPCSIYSLNEKIADMIRPIT